ncbi:hypothetical protein AB0284_17650 [Pseudarthrobacter phenanthrenivorans]|uniref:hypothetical protein n=1 Tax=Pseudarthrobacter phenanthrenivorans TaxID=361575 RepID=UPI00344D62D4
MAPDTEGSRDPLPGEEWAYRLRDDAPSEKVHIVTVHRKGRKIRVDIRHLEGQQPGTEENVPRSRLKVLWQNVDRYNASMEAWRRLRAGGTTKNLESREETATSPEFEYDYYLCWQQPVHEILRQWCGYRAVTAHERLLAAEAEVKRLDILLAEAVDRLRRMDEGAAEMIEREHEEERITAYAIRPVPQRPLKPHEIPRIEVPARRGWYR